MRRHRITAAIAAAAALLFAATADPAAAAPASSASVAPGTFIYTPSLDRSCTIGFVDTERAIAYTAAHCAPSASTPTPVYARGNNHTPLGYFWPTHAYQEQGMSLTDARSYIAIALNDGVSVSNRLPNGTAITKAIDAPEDIAAGDRICTQSWQSSTCGTVTSSTATSVVSTVEIKGGDSGGPVYRDDGNNQATLIGLAVRHNASGTTSAISPAPFILKTLSAEGMPVTW